LIPDSVPPRRFICVAAGRCSVVFLFRGVLVMRRKSCSLAVRLALLCLCWSALPLRASGQTVTSATVTGTIRDTTDAVVPGATVEVRNNGTNQVWPAVTDARGRFRLLYLPVGNYRLSVALDGFTP